jgi:O-antigen/teichoic acid export membrane protein
MQLLVEMPILHDMLYPLSLKQIESLMPVWLFSYWERLRSSPFFYRIIRGAFWLVVGAVISRGLTFASSALVARMLGKEGFGELCIIQSTLGMFGVFAGFGLGVTATKYVAELREKDKERAGCILGLSAVTSWTIAILVVAALFMLAPILAEKTLAAPHLTGEIRKGALLVLFGAISGAQTGALSGFEAFKQIAQVSISSGLAGFPFVVIGCWFFGLSGAIYGLIVTQAINCGLNWRALVNESRRSGVPLWSPKWYTELPVLWKFSCAAVLASVLISPSLWYCQTLLATQPSGFMGLAEYFVGAQWRGFVQYFPGLLSTAYLPVLASVINEENGRTLKIITGNVLLSTGVTAGCALLVFIAGPWILQAYGQSFTSAMPVLGLMLLTGIIDSANSTLLQTLMAAGKAWLRLISNSCWAVLMISVSLFLVPKYGALGLALAACIAQFIHLIMQIPLTSYALRQTR